MPVTDKDILTSATLYIQHHGENALALAMENIAKHERLGDIEGRETWNKIARAIQWMQNDDKTDNGTQH